MDNTFLYLIIIFIIISILIKNNYDYFDNINDDNSTITIPEFIPKKITKNLSNIHNIPLKIYQSWHTNIVPKNMGKSIKKLIIKNPEFDYYLYSDEKCRTFIQNNFDQDVLDAFDLLVPGAYKSDLWRYCILYINGGVYLDIKFYSNIPISKLLDYGSVVYVKDRYFYDMPITSLNNLYNAFILSVPNNIIFKYCIDDIVNSCKFKLYKNNPLDITGPGLLGSLVMKYFPEKYNEYTKLKLNGDFGHARIMHNDTVIFTEYSEYRNDQKMFQKKKHYHELWHDKKVYNLFDE